MSVVLVSGSPSSQSRSARLLDYAQARLDQHGLRHARISVRDLSAAALLHADVDHPEIVAAKSMLAASQAVIVATPVYKASYSGILKAFLDLLPQDGLRDKLVLPLASGGSSAHLLAVDYALRPVLAALGATIVLPSVFATDQQIQWSPEEGLHLGGDIAARLNEGVARLAETLAALGRFEAKTPEAGRSAASGVAAACFG